MSDHSDAFDHPKSTMLEDEEMPTFMSVSSKESLPFTDANIHQLPIDNTSISLCNNENSNEYQAQSRSPTTEEREDEGNEDNDDNEESSVYVLSSGDEADDRDPSPCSFDEDVDEEEEDEEDDDEEDIDDMDEIDPENEEVDAAEEDQLEDCSDEENEKDDVMSDDMALRSDKPKMMLQPKRSLSLQDLSDCSTIFPRRKPYITGGIKYRGVQSKVRRYIQDLKDMSRRSADKRLKSNEEINQTEDCQTQVCQDGEETEISHQPKGRRSIKGYAEQALKELEIREEFTQEDSDFISENPDHCHIIPNNNVQTKAKPMTIDQHHQHNNLNHEIKLENEIKKSKKVNLNGELGNECLNNIKTPEDLTVNYTMNGEGQGQNIMDVRSIGYDEYMRGSSNQNYKQSSESDKVTGKNDTIAGTNKNLNSAISGATAMVVTNVDAKELPNRYLKSVQIEEATPMDIVKHRDDSKAAAEAAMKEKIYTKTLEEMTLMKTQLNQKTTQCKEIREAYQKTLSENFDLKQELEDLKKTLSKLSAKKATPELVTVAIQTDPICSPAETTQQIAPADSCVNTKISSSTIASAFSYNDQWAESADSLPTSNGSTRPLPNLTPLSIADDSFIGVPSTPLRTPRQPSHAFQTSSKIIRMLSSITQRKSKVDGNVRGQDESTNIFDKAPGSSPAVSSYNLPVNHRISNKRKASDMPENANVLQPPKIPHTTSGFHRLNRRSKSEFAYPGDHVKLNSQSTAHQSSDLNGTQENLENSQKDDEPPEDLDNGVKCFTYREDENSPQTSFLIQAENESKSLDRDKDSKRASSVVVRECGPYLLGNVEVRMTEINGTINIWGKEVSQETIAQDENKEETDIDDEVNEKDPCEFLHKTPNVRNNPLSCSTNRKLKIPPLRMDESEFSKNFNSPSTSQTRESLAATDNFKQCQHLGNFLNSVESVYNPRDCESHVHSHNAFKCRRSSSLCEDGFQAEPSKNVNLNKCGCDWEHEGCKCSISCRRVSRHCHGDDCLLDTTNQREGGRCPRLNILKNNGHSKTDENHSRSQSLRFPTHCEGKSSTCSHAPRRHSFADDDDVFKKPSTSTARMNDSCCRSRSPSCINHSDDPLLPHHSHDSSEVLRRRRSSGKRVRGILMDFLRGCGDCHSINGPTNKVSPGVVPQVRVRPATPPCAPLNHTHRRTANYGSTNNRCIHTERCATCARRIEMATEIENQLEIFGAEMERLRSRSQAVLGMLNTLHSADTN